MIVVAPNAVLFGRTRRGYHYPTPARLVFSSGQEFQQQELALCSRDSDEQKITRSGWFLKASPIGDDKAETPRPCVDANDAETL